MVLGINDKPKKILPNDILEEYQLNIVGEFFFKPIPITEEWLLKLGFTQSPAFKNLYFIGTFLNITLGNKIMFEINDQIISEIKYVHQLQNLYFALTQKELAVL